MNSIKEELRQELIKEQEQERKHEYEMRHNWDYYIKHSKLPELQQLIEKCKIDLKNMDG